MKRFLMLSVLLVLLGNFGYAQELATGKTYSGGMLGFGMRSTFNYFDNNQSLGFGGGGQWKLGITQRVNTEWFLDYIHSSAGENALRNDWHIGWSVQFAPFGQGFGGVGEVTPYFLGGQCFDWTTLRADLGTETKKIGPRFSGAAQLGLGASWFPLERFEMTFQTQYMVHIGKDAHFEYASNDSDRVTDLQVEPGSALEGHLLLTVSANLYVADLW